MGSKPRGTFLGATNSSGYEPSVGDPVIIRGRIQELANGIAIVKVERPDESLVAADIDALEYDEVQEA
jgi:hypothetical protein